MKLATVLLLFLIVSEQRRYGGRAGPEGNAAHVYSQLSEARVARLTSSSSSSPAGALHIPTEPVIKMSLKPLLHPPSSRHKFLPSSARRLLVGVAVLLSLSIPDVGVRDVTACLDVEEVGRGDGEETVRSGRRVTRRGVDGGRQEVELLWDEAIVGSWHS
ncbi:hypothetical protein EYF80_044990 [Liparis tanakae]|uniref:Uncharacterized protein n=1 Tax=Liparis tanakae TaxID=230148 RepID=A0A4Z2FVB8_9TELE|nr:hypothetical protein EYF80_044990 [Liparis tanakae]